MVRNGFTFARIPIDRDKLFIKFLIGQSKERDSSKVAPKYLDFVTIKISRKTS